MELSTSIPFSLFDGSSIDSAISLPYWSTLFLSVFIRPTFSLSLSLSLSVAPPCDGASAGRRRGVRKMAVEEAKNVVAEILVVDLASSRLLLEPASRMVVV